MDFLYLLSLKCLWKTRPVRFFTRLNFNFHSDRVEEGSMHDDGRWMNFHPPHCWKTRLISSKIHFIWVSVDYSQLRVVITGGRIYESIGSVSWNKHGSAKGVDLHAFQQPFPIHHIWFSSPSAAPLSPDQSFSNWGHQINSAYLNLSPSPLSHTYLATSANFS